MPDAPSDAWVFHAGALGDFVLIWPLLRALVRAGRRVHLVADSEKARLAASEIEPGSISPHDSQLRPFTRLWAGAAPDRPDIHRRAALVFDFLTDPAAEAGARWTTAAQAMFPGARIITIGPPASPTRTVAWDEFHVTALGHAALRTNPAGPILCHVGAGAPSKRWPLERWAALAELLRDLPLHFLAGEVEAERFTADERALFASLAGVTCTTLADLAAHIRSARAFLGADTGPTHLAAQMGLPTLALFGPTDPAIWAPVGPRVRAIAPAQSAPMAWLEPDHLARALRALLASPTP